MMRQGDFTELAQAYIHRPAYAEPVIDAVLDMLGGATCGPLVADVGAGTGKLTTMLSGRGLTGWAVEPNDAMRAEGERLALPGFTWRAGQAEATGLERGSVDWVTMASAFHWTDAPAALKEFHRILHRGGLLTVMWNPRDLERDRLQAEIEAEIAAIAPNIQRRSSGAAPYTVGLEETLLAGELFKDPLFMEAPHVETMSAARHLGAWESVNDIRAQAGEAVWRKILAAIAAKLEGRDQIDVRYRTRAWTVRKA